ncbi:leucyl/phenylalanyl-tRNA--protein transferase [Pseudoxanthomonas sp. SGD-10]|nr:leucyl/phenylalanyl-tRNA--protein transferase [Pseudoxanthomonas sp. SGD-10]
MIFQLTEEIIFPPPHLAEDDGLLAVGGDLSTERLLLAYSNGIFPWYSDDTPILWYSPHERFVLFPEKLRVSKSMKQVIKSGRFSVTFNQDFVKVIHACSSISRPGQDGTWITKEMKKAYTKLHHLGFAHSVEVWEKNNLVGGLYGVLVNNVFCGESMFSEVSNSSKLALVWLCENLEIKLVDCQVYTPHLESMGAEMIDRTSYLNFLKHTGV